MSFKVDLKLESARKQCVYEGKWKRKRKSKNKEYLLIISNDVLLYLKVSILYIFIWKKLKLYINIVFFM